MTLSPEIQQALATVERNPRLARLVADIWRVLDLIPTDDAGPAIHREGPGGLMARTGIGRARIAYCVQWVRHNLPEIGDSLISGPEGYRRTMDEFRVREYRRHWLGHMRTGVKTILFVATPLLTALMRTGRPDQRLLASQISLGLQRVVQDIDALIEA